MDMPKRPDDEPKYSDSGNVDPSVETYDMKSPMDEQQKESQDERLAKMSHAVEVLLDGIGFRNLEGSMVKTPMRYAKALLECTKGYDDDPRSIIQEGMFPGGTNDIIIVRDITFHSLCEHHILPFHGKVNIGYVHKTKKIGLSKFARVVNAYARRLQTQENLGAQIAEAILEFSGAEAAYVYITAEHMCMSMRGVSKPGAVTETYACRRKHMPDGFIGSPEYSAIRQLIR